MLERGTRRSLAQPPAHSTHLQDWSRLPRAFSHIVFKTFKDGDNTTSLGNLFHCLTALMMKTFLLTPTSLVSTDACCLSFSHRAHVQPRTAWFCLLGQLPVGTPYDSRRTVSALSRHLFSTSFSVTQAWLEAAPCMCPQKGSGGQDIPRPLEAWMEIRDVPPLQSGGPRLLSVPLQTGQGWSWLRTRLDSASANGSVTGNRKI